MVHDEFGDAFSTVSNEPDLDTVQSLGWAHISRHVRPVDEMNFPTNLFGGLPDGFALRTALDILLPRRPPNRKHGPWKRLRHQPPLYLLHGSRSDRYSCHLTSAFCRAALSAKRRRKGVGQRRAVSWHRRQTKRETIGRARHWLTPTTFVLG